MNPSIAVVILNWNGIEHLKTFLPSVVQHADSAKIYLADNASTDNSVNYVKQHYPRVHHIQNKKNEGFAAGYNQALSQLDEDYFILLNSDVEVSENWIQPVIALMEKDKKIGIAQPKIKSYREKNKFEYAGAGGGMIDALGYPFCRGRIFNTLEEDHGQYDDSKEVFWASGACMFIKAAVFRKFNGFDPSYFAHMEEIDLCWRAKNCGFSVFYVGESTVYHLGGGTMKNTNPKKTYLNFRNSLTTLYKNDQSGIKWIKIFLRLFLDGIAFFKLWVDSGSKHAVAILKAHFYFYNSKKQSIKAENINAKGVYPGSIVLSYYLFKQKKFSQLKYGSKASKKN